MASRMGILAVAFLSYAILPQLASAFLPNIPGLLGPGQDFFSPHIIQQPDFGEQPWKPIAESKPEDGVPADEPNPRITQQPVFGGQPWKPIPESKPEEGPKNGFPAAESKPRITQHPIFGGQPWKPIPESQPEDEVPANEPNPHTTQQPVFGGQPRKPVPESKAEEGPEDGFPTAESNPRITQQPIFGGQPWKPIPESKPEDGGGAVEAEPEKEGLREGFYEQSCPHAEKIVTETIHKHFRKDPSLAPALVRLFLHDCFVTGCDASILLDETPTGEHVEKKAPQNGPFVRGYETIDDIKLQLEAECPGVVSCADILAFANRDSLVFTGVPSYEVAAGRRDSRASLAKNVEGNLPLPGTSAKENIQMFQKKGMSLEELVVLVGAHSIGSAHCSIVSPRFFDPEKAKEIDRGYLLKMMTLANCQTDSQDIPFDPYSQHKMDSRFYKQLLTNQALLESDHKLANEPSTRNIMEKLVDDQTGWLTKFTSAIKKLGEIEVLPGNQGEIRKQCRAVN